MSTTSSSSSVKSFFNTFISSILILFLHLGCFMFTTADHRHPTNKKRQVTPLSSNSSSHQSSNCVLKPHRSWSYIKRIFTSKKHPPSTKSNTNITEIQSTTTTSPTPVLSTSSSSRNFIVKPTTATITTDTTVAVSSSPLRKRRTRSSSSDPDFSFIDYPSFPLRQDIVPCTICGEILHTPQLLDQHESIKHAFTELHDVDPGKNVVQIIFKTGWKNNNYPKVHRILKIRNSPKILEMFEDYRKLVKSKEEEEEGIVERDERCVANGNELLRFHCATFICNLGHNGNYSNCSQEHCNLCRIIRSGFSGKMDRISTFSNSWRAHVSFAQELDQEFAFMNVKRVMLVCRVIAGRIAGYQGGVDKVEERIDKVVGEGGDWTQSRLDEEELLVVNPAAVLPCFAITYSM